MDNHIEENTTPLAERFRTMIEPNNFKRYAGMNAIEISENMLVYQVIEKISTYLNFKGYTLVVNSIEGIKNLFENGSEFRKEIFIPFDGFNGKYNTDVGVYSLDFIGKVFSSSKERMCKAINIARKFHPNFDQLDDKDKLTIVCCSYQILGLNLDTPVDFVVCYTLDGCESNTTCTKETGVIGQSISIAHYYNVPIFNLYNTQSVYRLKAYLDSKEGIFDGN